MTQSRDTDDSAGAAAAAAAENEDSPDNECHGKEAPKQMSDEELQLAYLRHMAKYMPANWLLRASQALQLNLNYVSCDSQVPWLNALVGRLFWDFLNHDYWARRMQEKIQGKLRKLHVSGGFSLVFK